MADNPIHLTILRRGDIHIVDLAEVQAIIPRSETRVETAFLEEISQEIKRITNLVGPEFRKAAASLEPEVRRNPYVVRELKDLGSLIFSHLLPQAAREKLRNSESCNLYLRLDDQLVHIPWELAFDGQHFLGMKFRVGRQIITHHKVSQRAPGRAASDTLRVLIVADPSETLRNVSQESEQLCEILDGVSGLQVRLLGGRGVKRIPLLAALRGSDIVHFAGHSQFDEKNPENSGWLLHDGLLSASEISKLDQAPLIVFSNSCQAGATKDWKSDYLYEGEAFGLGSAFLLAGVSNYVGTFCVVHDEESRFLAVEFYRRVAQGKSIGQALLEARLATAEEMGLDRLTWASYMLYGDPDFTLPVTTKQSSWPVESFVDVGSPAPESKVALSSMAPEERRSWFRWPRFRLSISVSITAALAVALTFGFLLSNYSEIPYMSPTLMEPLDKKPTPQIEQQGRAPSQGDLHKGSEPAKDVASASPGLPRPESEASAKAGTGPASISPPVVGSGKEQEHRGKEERATSIETKQPAAVPEAAQRREEPPVVAQSRAPAAESPPRPAPKPSQDLRELKVQVDHLQVAGREVIIFMRILNKTSSNLAIVLGDTRPFMTDNKGFSYSYTSSSGIKLNQYHPQNWTFIPPYGDYTLSMRFGEYDSRPQRDSLYSISAEIVLATREAVERTRPGYPTERARIVNISIHGIEAQ